jgi:hypothetical protein
MVNKSLLTPKIRKIGILETKEFGPEPKWANCKELPLTEYMSQTARAIKWYHNVSSKKEGKEFFIAWFHNHFPKRRQEVKFLSTAKPDYFSNLLCALYLLENQGWSARFGILRHVVKHIQELYESIQKHSDQQEETTESVVTNQPSIQDRIREQAGVMSEFIDYAIDEWITNPELFDPKNYKIINVLRISGAKAVHARYIKGFFSKSMAEIQDLVNGSADEQLREAYKNKSKKNIKKLLEFYQNVELACNQIIGEAKITRKPRVKKVKPANDLVKKLKFLTSYDELGLASIPPSSIIGASVLVVYNVRTRKIGYYIAKSSSGLTVKGSVLDNYSDKSIQKTLRKPAEQLKEFRNLNTLRRFENWINKEITTTDTALSGRFNEDTIILKAFK